MTEYNSTSLNSLQNNLHAAAEQRQSVTKTTERIEISLTRAKLSYLN